MTSYRDRFDAVWRWPLYSRGRAVGTLAAVLIGALVWSNLAKSADVVAATTSATSAISSTPAQPTDRMSIEPTPESVNDAQITAEPPESLPASDDNNSRSGSSTGPTLTQQLDTSTRGSTAADTSGEPVDTVVVGPLNTAPAPPRTTSTPSDFESPITVAQTYMSAWCYQPSTGAANLNIANTTPWVTAAGWEDDKSRAITDTDWAQTQKAGVTTVCGPVEAQLLTSAPNSEASQWVQIRTQQARINSAGEVIGQSTVTQTRRILLNTDGRWLVDVQVQAG